MAVNKNVIGRATLPGRNEVEKGAIRKFAEAIGDTNRLYFDEEFARSQGYKSVVAPPTFPVTFIPGSNPREGIDIDYQRLLHGDQTFVYERAICAGDVLWTTSRVVDAFEKAGKRGGSMDFYVFEDESRDGDGNVVCRARRTIILREA